MDCATLAEAIAAALREVLGADGFDVIPDETGVIVDIAADEWTLRIEGNPVIVAWISIDDEPDGPQALPAARRAVMSRAVDKALAESNQRFGGVLAAALDASGDPLSRDLFATLAARDRGE